MSERDERARPGLLSAGSVVRTALVVLLAYAVLGAVAGVVWEWIWTPPGQIIDRHQVLFDSYASLRRVFSGTGLYALVGGVTSALIALAVTTLTRGRELWVLLFVIVGSAIGAALMWRVGTQLGPTDPASLATHASGRTAVAGNLTVSGRSPFLVWPMTSLFVLAMIYFAWPNVSGGHDSATPSTDRREADTSQARPG
jgi:hypothetical protein